MTEKARSRATGSAEIVMVCAACWFRRGIHRWANIWLCGSCNAKADR